MHNLLVTEVFNTTESIGHQPIELLDIFLIGKIMKMEKLGQWTEKKKHYFLQLLTELENSRKAEFNQEIKDR